MTEPRWLTRAEVDAMQRAEVVRDGGLPGCRDDGAVESALARPQQKWAYGTPDLPELAAAYGFGLAKNHGYLDGNKRIGFLALAVFLELNGARLVAPQLDAVATMLAVAAGEMPEDDLAAWVRRWTEPRA